MLRLPSMLKRKEVLKIDFKEDNITNLYIRSGPLQCGSKIRKEMAENVKKLHTAVDPLS